MFKISEEGFKVVLSNGVTVAVLPEGEIREDMADGYNVAKSGNVAMYLNGEDEGSFEFITCLYTGNQEDFTIGNVSSLQFIDMLKWAEALDTNIFNTIQ